MSFKQKILKIRDKFPLIKKNKLIYLNNSTTSLKPLFVLNKVKKFLFFNCLNDHTLEHSLNYESQKIYNNTKKNLQKFLNNKNLEELFFCNNSSDASNKIVVLFEKLFKENDEVIMTNFEHNTTLLPWIYLKNKLNIKIKFLKTNSFGKISISSLRKQLSNKTKAIVFASNNNITGYFNNPDIINSIVKKYNKNILTIVDASQSVMYKKIDVQKWKSDILYFSAHKLFSLFGLGIFYIKKELLKKTNLIFLNSSSIYEVNKTSLEIKYNIKDLFEPGTNNTLSILSFNEALKFCNKIKYLNYSTHLYSLKNYLEKKLIKNFKDILTIYNPKIKSNILIFSLKNINNEDLSAFLSKNYNIILRVGQHCSFFATSKFKNSPYSTIRVSFNIYNTKKEINTLIFAISEFLKKGLF